MKRLIRIAAVLAALTLAGGPALAQGHGHGREHGRGHSHDGGGWERGPGGWRGERGPPPGRGGGRGHPPDAYVPYAGASIYPRRLPPPGYGLRRGGVIPPQYRGDVVPDYRHYRLRPPPPGFAWVRMGDRYMLVSRATGQIFDVIGE